MKISVREVAIELAAEKSGKFDAVDFDKLPYWKQITYEVEAAKIIRIMNRLVKNKR